MRARNSSPVTRPSEILIFCRGLEKLSRDRPAGYRGIFDPGMGCRQLLGSSDICACCCLRHWQIALSFLPFSPRRVILRPADDHVGYGGRNGVCDEGTCLAGCFFFFVFCSFLFFLLPTHPGQNAFSSRRASLLCSCQRLHRLWDRLPLGKPPERLENLLVRGRLRQSVQS